MCSNIKYFLSFTMKLLKISFYIIYKEVLEVEFNINWIIFINTTLLFISSISLWLVSLVSLLINYADFYITVSICRGQTQPPTR